MLDLVYYWVNLISQNGELALRLFCGEIEVAEDPSHGLYLYEVRRNISL